MHFQQKQTNQQMYNPGDLDDPLYGTLANYDFSIVRPNYFAGQSAFLHFFINKAKIMKICNLETKQWLTRQIDYQVPGFHKSIVAPNGDIYISGGVINSKDNRKDPIVRKYTLDGRIQQIGQLTLPRSSHSMVYCNQAIYILCGFDEHSNITSSMEKYNINTQKMEQCAPCNKPANQPACCTFNDRYIYKFGGNDDNGQILLIIERYDTFTNKWEYINPEIDPLESSKFQTTFQSASCVQINQNNIFVFGGYDNEDRGVHFSFLLNFEQDIHKIRQVDTRPLLYPEGFWNNQVIIHDHKMFVLQNIEIEANHIDENNRCLLCFDGYRWSELQYQNSI
ncbi:unnamed protein product [Paramecium octaurelia]|uniref:Attractin/MKLN-like beta-propeller domain-containing protein n=1 Tax=Paramecium octaurelia TaxID=43137 RepID=A0A8S1SVY4_PAROT|nr:unnamed protein product [Paramecium octaurelia]